MERRLVVPLPTDRISRREDVVVYRTRLSNQADPLKLGLWNKSNDFTHVRLQNWGMPPFWMTAIIPMKWGATADLPLAGDDKGIKSS
jgi:hypothetical protein